MCEIIVVGSDEPVPFSRLESWALRAEKYGIAGCGWGIAYLERPGHVNVFRCIGKLGENPEELERYRQIESKRWLLHFRRPLRLPNVLNDLQPFYSESQDFAYAHNGDFAKADEFRHEFEGLLGGRVDSEVGFRMTERFLAEGFSLGHACLKTLDTLGGSANVALLYNDGSVWIDGNANFNKFWQFKVEEMTCASTSLIFADESFFDLVYDNVPTNRALVNGEISLLSALA